MGHLNGAIRGAGDDFGPVRTVCDVVDVRLVPPELLQRLARLEPVDAEGEDRGRGVAALMINKNVVEKSLPGRWGS